MRALIKEAGEVRLVEVPTPSLRRADDVLIQVLVAGICRTDLHVAAGTIASADPITLGHELCGRIVACGPAAGVEVGALVTVHPVIDGGFLGVTQHGAFADFVVVPARNVLVLPEVDPRAGAYVEPIAAALAVPEALAGRTDRAARVGVFGANRFADLIVEVLRLEGFAGEREIQPGLDVGVETSGTAGEALAILCEALRPGGLLILKSRNPGTVPLPIATVVEKQLELRGVHYGSFARAIELVATGTLDLARLFGERFPLARWDEAFARSGEARKLFLEPGDRCVG